MKLDQDKIRGGYLIYVRDRCVCQYCGFDGKRSPQDWAQLQIDHLIPSLIEHRNEPLNTVVACYYCNTLKKNFDPSNGKLTRILDENTRNNLIEAVVKYLYEKKKKIWINGGGFEKSYCHMMKSIEKNET